jgi:hypothetical protein
MFLLSFHKAVFQILDWEEPPQNQYMNDHERALYRKSQTFFESSLARIQSMDPNEAALRLYIKRTYPAYFGIHIGPTRDVARMGDRVYNKF